MRATARTSPTAALSAARPLAAARWLLPRRAHTSMVRQRYRGIALTGQRPAPQPLPRASPSIMTRSVHQSTQRHLAQRWRRRNAAARAACFGGIIAALSDTAPIRRLCIAPLCIMYGVSESADLLLLWLESEGQAFGPFLPPPTAGFRGGRGSRNGGFVTALQGRRCLIRDPTRRLRWVADHVCARRAQRARLQSLAMHSKTRRKFRGVDPVRPRLLWRGYERLAGRLMLFGTFRNRCVTFDV